MIQDIKDDFSHVPAGRTYKVRITFSHFQLSLRDLNIQNRESKSVHVDNGEPLRFNLKEKRNLKLKSK